MLFALAMSSVESPRTVLILNHNLRERGTFFRAWKMAEGFRDRGDRVIFFTTGPQYYRPRQGEDSGMLVVETPNTALAHGPDGGWLPLGVLARLLHVRRLPRIDLVYTFSHKPVDVMPARWARKYRGALWVADWCDLWGGEGLHGLMRQKFGPPKTLRQRFDARVVQWDEEWERRTAVECDFLTVISSDLRRRATPLRGGKPIHFLPSGADLERIQPLPSKPSREALKLPQGVPLLGYMTSWYPDEAFTLNALRRVLAAHPQACVAIAGPPLENQERLLSEVPLRGRVYHCGRLPFAEVPEFLAACDVLLMPLEDTVFNRSRWPNKIGDYLAAARPQVACGVGDVRPFLDEARLAGYPLGICTQPTVESFAQGILEMLEIPEQWHTWGRNARHHAENSRYWPVIFKAFHQALEREFPTKA